MHTVFGLFLFVERLAARNGVALGTELLMQLKRIPAAVRLGEHALEGHVQARRAQLLQKAAEKRLREMRHDEHFLCEALAVIKRIKAPAIAGEATHGAEIFPFSTAFTRTPMRMASTRTFAARLAGRR